MSFNLKVKKASNSRSTFNLTFPHLSSAEFLQNNVVFAKYTVPSDHWKINPAFEARCAALTNPSFVNTQYHLRAFYVPHSIVWKRFDDWINLNPTYVNGELYQGQVPVITDVELTKCFTLDSSMATNTQNYTIAQWTDISGTTDITHTYDFIVFVENTYKAYKLTNKGRYIFKLLVSLGYKFVWTLDPDESTDYNALPILSYARIFLDYFIPSVQRLKSASNKFCSYWYTSNETHIYNIPSASLLSNCFSEWYHCFYPSSYLTSAWQTPTKPLSDDGSSADAGTSAASRASSYNSAFGSILNYDTDATDNLGNVSGGWSDGSFGLSTASSNNPWIQRNVQRVVDWLTRSRFVGAEQALNILSRFGVKPKYAQDHSARHIGSYTQPLVVQDINAQSDTFEELDNNETRGAKLGDYAGKMFTQAQRNSSFEVNCDDYGMIIITSMISPADIYYYQGIDREVMKTKPVQWYQPEFDSVGFEVLSSRELMSGFYLPGTAALAGDVGVGFVPRYSSYKVSNAVVSGDFSVPSLNSGMSSFHHFRGIYKYGRYSDGNSTWYNFPVPDTGIKDDVNTTQLTSASQVSAQTSLLITSYDKNQFNRIFNVTDDGIDHIYTMYYFDVTANRPMRSIADSLLTLDGDESEKVGVNKPMVENG